MENSVEIIARHIAALESEIKERNRDLALARKMLECALDNPTQQPLDNPTQQPDAKPQTPTEAVREFILKHIEEYGDHGVSTAEFFERTRREGIEAGQNIVSTVLSRLGATGVIVKTGSRRDARWRMPPKDEAPGVPAPGASKTDKPRTGDHLGLFLSTSTGQRPNGEGNSPERGQYEQNGRTADTGDGSE